MRLVDPQTMYHYFFSKMIAELFSLSCTSVSSSSEIAVRNQIFFFLMQRALEYLDHTLLALGASIGQSRTQRVALSLNHPFTVLVSPCTDITEHFA